MAYSYAKDFHQRGLANAMPSFLLKRFARVMPLHFFMTVTLLLYTLYVSPTFIGGEAPAFNSATPVRDVVMNLFLLHGLGLAPNMNAPSWSISVEMFAYLLFPIFLLLVFNRNSLIRWMCTVITVFLLIFTAVQQPQLGLATSDVKFTLIRGFTEFILGLVAYRIYSLRTKAIFFGSDKFIFALTGIAGAMMLGRLWDLVAVFTFPFIILGIAHNRGIVTKLLIHRLPYFLGVISFSLYLIHSPLAYLELQTLKYFHPALLTKPIALLCAATGALSIIPLAWIVYKAIEFPGRELIRRAVNRTPYISTLQL